VHFPTLKSELLGVAMKTFYDVRNLPGLKKKPSTSELLDWLKLLLAQDIPLSALQTQDDKVAVPPLVGALLKNEQDVSLLEKLVFMQSRNRGCLQRCDVLLQIKNNPGDGTSPARQGHWAASSYWGTRNRQLPNGPTTLAALSQCVPVNIKPKNFKWSHHGFC
jgi:hypothetical protein